MLIRKCLELAIEMYLKREAFAAIPICEIHNMRGCPECAEVSKMKTEPKNQNHKIVKVDWYGTWIATRSLAAVLGVIATGAYFATPLRGLIAVSSAAISCGDVVYVLPRGGGAARAISPAESAAQEKLEPISKFNRKRLADVRKRLERGIDECTDEVVRETLWPPAPKSMERCAHEIRKSLS